MNSRIRDDPGAQHGVWPDGEGIKPETSIGIKDACMSGTIEGWGG